MTASDIIGKFRRADNKKEMLQILAELNGCSKDAMKSYLLEHGASENDFPKRGRKPKVAKEEAKNTAKEKVPHMEPVKTVDQTAEMSEPTPKEQSQVDRALVIPKPVRRAIADRVDVLATKIMEMEKERDCLLDYLEGVVHTETR